jgi:hypothetical protein
LEGREVADLRREARQLVVAEIQVLERREVADRRREACQLTIA